MMAAISAGGGVGGVAASAGALCSSSSLFSAGGERQQTDTMTSLPSACGTLSYRGFACSSVILGMAHT